MDVYLYASAADAAGTDHLSLADHPETLHGLIEYLLTHHDGTTTSGTPLDTVLGLCSFLLDGRSAEENTPLDGIRRVDVIPPFAGG